MLVFVAVLALLTVLGVGVTMPVLAQSPAPGAPAGGSLPGVVTRAPATLEPGAQTRERPGVAFPVTRPAEAGGRVRGLLLLLFGIQRSSGSR
jgi:hypothetical protein